MPKKKEEKAEGNTIIYIIIGVAALLVAAIFLLRTPPPPLFATITPLQTETLEVTNTTTSTTTKTFTPTRTVTNTIIRTPTKTITPTPTDTTIRYASSSPPAPVVGPIILNGPRLFRVEDWITNNPMCGLMVTIYGIVISHGKAPYTFTFWSQKVPYILDTPIIKQITSLDNSREYVEFIPPVTIVKGKYKHVEFIFQDQDGKQVSWIDDLFYQIPDESCN